MVKRGKRIVSKILCATVLFTMTAVPGAVFAESDEALEAADTGSKAVETEAPDAANEAAQTEQKAAAPAAQKEETKAPAQESQAAPKAQAAKSQAKDSQVATHSFDGVTVSVTPADKRNGNTVTACKGTVTLKAVLINGSDGTYDYTWYKKGRIVNTIVGTNSSYTPDDNGAYYVRVNRRWDLKLGKESETITVNFENHNAIAAGAKAATCTEEGHSAYWTCNKCGKLFENASATKEITQIPTIPKKPHNITTHAVNLDATCTTDGHLEHWACTSCGALFWDQAGTKPATEAEVTIPAAHTWEADYTVDNEPTCTTTGSKSIHCKNCDATTSEQTIDMLPHTLTKTEAKAATCTEPGHDAYWTCEICKQRFADENGKELIPEIIPTDPLGHDLKLVEKVDATCLKDGHEAYWECKTCGKIFADEACQNELEAPVVIKATGHKFGDWKVVKDPTVGEAGMKERVCEKCGYTETEAIPALDAAKEKLAKATADKANDDSAKTGDDMNVALYSLLALLAASGAVGAAYRRRTTEK